MTAEISKIEIKVAGKVLVLTLEQAKELRDILDEAFPKVTIQTFPVVINSQPVVIQPPVVIPQPVYPHWTTTPFWCEGTTCGTLQLSATN